MFKTITVLALLLTSSTPLLAKDWMIRPNKAPHVTKGMTSPPPDGLHDGDLAQDKDSQQVIAAWYTMPTSRYRHGILGDAIEGGALAVKTPEGGQLTYVLPNNQVFEDRTPRLFDLGANGKTEIITILSDVTKGASIAIFGIEAGQLTLLAQTPYIGTANRWRNIAGIADYNGDGKMQIAEVVTPHIGGTLKLWTWDRGQLVLSGEVYGFSNHKIGSPEQNLSVSDDFNGDGVADLALPSVDRKNLKLMSFSSEVMGKWAVKTIADIPLPMPIDKTMSAQFVDETPTVQIGLEDNTYWTVEP